MSVLLLLLVLNGAPPEKVDFNKDELGGPAADFEALVGDWRVAELGEQKGLLVDGSKWRTGTPSANLADQARRLYGERYAEFLDGVKSFAFFPLAVWKGSCAAPSVTLSVRFFPNNGRIDQGAGIAFDVKPDGSYFGVRANALEDNLLFFKVVKGKRTIIDMVRGPAPVTRTWHTLTLELTGKAFVVKVDGDVKHRGTLDAAPTGKCGLWSKADSQVLFDDFTVTPAP
jgi:hypothetical protein